jgi:hypothetical protein
VACSQKRLRRFYLTCNLKMQTGIQTHENVQQILDKKGTKQSMESGSNKLELSLNYDMGRTP